MTTSRCICVPIRPSNAANCCGSWRPRLPIWKLPSWPLLTDRVFPLAPFNTIYVTGAISGLAATQSSPVLGDHIGNFDVFDLFIVRVREGN